MSLPVRKILIVDDSPEDRETWRRYLASDPAVRYEITERDSMEAGLAACQEERPECILLDHNLPDGTGIEFLRGLQKIGGTLAFPTVMLTGTGSEAVAVEAMKTGAQDYLMKNRLQPDALHRALHGAVNKATIERLLAQQRVELEEAYRQAQEANTSKDQFLATLSHELRTPLNAILGWTQVLRGDPDNSEDVESGLATIERNARAQNQIIEDLLDMSKIISGKVRLDVQPIHLDQAVAAAVDTMRPAAAAKNIRLQA